MERKEEVITTEERVASTLLQEKRVVELGGRRFTVAPPSVATLVRLSAVVSRLPRFGEGAGDGGAAAQGAQARGERMLQEVLARAEGCAAVGETGNLKK